MPQPTSMSWPAFFLLSFVTVFLYFEVPWQVWFLKLLDGYLIKIWVPPLLLFIGIVLGGIYRNGLRLKTHNPPLTALLLLYLFFGFVAMWVNEPIFHNKIKFYLIMCSPVLFFFVLLSKFRNNADVKNLFKILLVCIFLQGAHAFYNFQTWLMAGQPARMEHTIETSKGNVIGDPYHVAEFGVGQEQRGQARFTDFSFEQSRFAAIIFPGVVLGLFFGSRRKGVSKLFLYSFALFLISLGFATLSRSAFIAYLVGLLVYVSCLLRFKLIKLQYGMILLAGVVVVILSSTPAVVRFVSSFNIEWFSEVPSLIASGVSLDERHAARQLGFWGDAHYLSYFISLTRFLSSPFLGVGYTEMQNISDLIAAEHNRYLFVLASAGLATFIPYFLSIMLIIFHNFKTILFLYRKDPKHPDLALGLVLLACNCMFVVKLNNEGDETYFYWIIFALTAAWVRNCREGLLKLPNNPPRLVEH